ncbi:transposable element Tcb1 transposase [Trichonephila clavipes]|nr:transposable element Tcb1 transposase [Trichonephila clavipes]
MTVQLPPGSWQHVLVYCYSCTNVGFINVCYTVPLYRIPLTANHRQLRLQWAHEQRAWQADWHQVAFSGESRFNLCAHDGRIRVRGYAGERCLPECVIERHSGLTPRVMVWGAISYRGRSDLL